MRSCRLYLIVAFHFQVSYISPYNFSQFLLKLYLDNFCFLSLVFCTLCHSWKMWKLTLVVEVFKEKKNLMLQKQFKKQYSHKNSERKYRYICKIYISNFKVSVIWLLHPFSSNFEISKYYMFLKNLLKVLKESIGL